MTKLWTSVLTGGLSVIAAGGTAAGIAVPQILKLKDGVDKFIPNNRDWIDKTDKSQSEGLNYVSLGDSISAGYNSYLGKDYLSYSDFLAKDMQNANVLNNYKNYSVSGAKINDMQNTITRTPSIMSDLGNADVITVHIGSNDLLAYVRMAEANFGFSLEQMMGISSGNADRDSAIGQIGSSSDAVSIDHRWDLLNNSLTSLSKMSSVNNFDTLINMQPELIDTAFDMIERDMTNLIGDLGKIADNANVLILGPAFPFINMPDSIVNGNPNPDYFDSFSDAFQQFNDRLASVTDLAGFARFQSLDELPEYANDNSGYKDRAVKAAASDIITNPTEEDLSDAQWHYRKMPNIADIHPSVYGYELIGNGLFNLLNQENAKTFAVGNSEDFYTKSQDPNDNSSDDAKRFERSDEAALTTETNSLDNTLRGLLRENSTQNLLSELLLAFGSSTTSTVENKTATKVADNPLSGLLSDELLSSLFGKYEFEIEPSEMLTFKFNKTFGTDSNLQKAIQKVFILAAEAGLTEDGKAAGVIKNFVTQLKASETEGLGLGTILEMLPFLTSGIFSDASLNNFEDFRTLLADMGAVNLLNEVDKVIETSIIDEDKLNLELPEAKIDEYVSFVDALNLKYNAAFERSSTLEINNLWNKIASIPKSNVPYYLEKWVNELKNKNPDLFQELITETNVDLTDPENAKNLVTNLYGAEDIDRLTLTDPEKKTALVKSMANHQYIENSDLTDTVYASLAKAVLYLNS